MATATLSAVTTELRRRMGTIPSAGVSNCRPKRINGELRLDKGYSEHAWGNAEDLRINGYSAQKPYVDMLNRMKSEGYPVGTVLWAGNRPTDHSDHIHVEGSPALGKPGLKPPCAGGKAPTETPVNLPVGTGAPGAGGSTGSSNDAAWEDISLGLFGNLPVSRGQISFALIGILAVVLMIVFLVNAFKGKIIEQVAPVGKLVKGLT